MDKKKLGTRITAMFLTVLMIFTIVPFSAFAANIIDSGKCGDNVYWTLYDDGELVISGEGDMYNYAADTIDRVSIFSPREKKIKIVTIKPGVTSICNNAFIGCESLISVAIPKSVTSIGRRSFYMCFALTDIKIHEGVTLIGDQAFYGCQSMTSIIIPHSMDSISWMTFGECTSLTSITIPDSITVIENGAFTNCKSLKTIYYTGTQNQWNEITIDYSRWDDDPIWGAENECLKTATIIFNNDPSETLSIVDAYKRVLQTYQSEDPSYTIYDIDKDNVPELIICVGLYNANRRYKIYTFNNGQAEYLDEEVCGYSKLYGADGQNGVYVYYNHTLYVQIKRMSIIDNQLSSSTVIELNLDAGDDPSALDKYLYNHLRMVSTDDYTLLESLSAIIPGENGDQSTGDDEYIQKVKEYINTDDFQDIINDMRWAAIVDDGLNSTNTNIAQFSYNVLHNFGSVITLNFKDMYISGNISMSENPYDFIIAEMISSNKYVNSVGSLFEKYINNDALKFYKSIEKICQDSSKWEFDDFDFSVEMPKLLAADAYDSSNAFHVALGNFLQSKNIDSFTAFNGIALWKEAADAGSSVKTLVDAFIKCSNYKIAVDAFSDANNIYVDVFKKMAEIMGSDNPYFTDTINRFVSCADTEEARNVIYQKIVIEGVKVLDDVVFHDIYTDAAKATLSVCFTKILGLSKEAATTVASKIFAAVWAYDTGLSLGDMITNNEDKMVALSLIRANGVFEDTAKLAFDTFLNEFYQSPTENNARLVDNSISILKMSNIYTMDKYAEYLETDHDAIIWNMVNRFMRNVLNSDKKFKDHTEELGAITEFKAIWENVGVENYVSKAIEGEINKVHNDMYIVACPTDVFVYNENNEPIASIVNSEVQSRHDCEITVIDDMKSIVIPSGKNYTVKVVAADAGAMDYYVINNCNSNNELFHAYTDIELYAQDEFLLPNNQENNFLIKNDSYAFISNSCTSLQNLDMSDFPEITQIYFPSTVEYINSEGMNLPNDISITAQKNSAAQQFAEDNDFPFVPIADYHNNTVTIKGYTPTCTEDGLTDGVICADCGEIIVAQTVIPATGHDGVETVIDGETCIVCSVCGEILSYDDNMSTFLDIFYPEDFVIGDECILYIGLPSEGVESGVITIYYPSDIVSPTTFSCYADYAESYVLEDGVMQIEFSFDFEAPCDYDDFVDLNFELLSYGSVEFSVETDWIGKENPECAFLYADFAPPSDYTLGDVNNDGQVTAADARLALRISAQLETADDYMMLAADADKNGRITAADARKILRVSARLESFR